MEFIQGSSFELAVAIPIKNNKFYKGQYKKVVLDEDLATSSVAIKYDRTSYDGLYLEHFLQYGDEVTLGPSTKTANIKEVEHLIVTGVEKINSDYGYIYLRDKNNSYIFSQNDIVSFYGTGLAEGWHLDTYCYPYVKSEGIKKGPVSRQLVKSFSYSATPSTGEYEKLSSDPTGLLNMRFHTGHYGFAIDYLSSYLDYIQQPLYLYNDEPWAKIAVTNLASITGTQNVLLGHYHKGGWRKAFAQRLNINHTKDTPSGSMFYQNLLDWGDEPIVHKRRKSLLIPYQFYRIGGKVLLDPINSSKIYNTDYNIYLELRTSDNLREYNSEAIKVDILNGSNANSGLWFAFSKSQLLASGISNTSMPKVSLLFENRLDSGDTSNQDMNLYMDEIWVEHAGGVQYAQQDGCLNFQRYGVWPEQGTIAISKKEEAFGKELKVLEAKIDYCTQEFWDQLELIFDWQKRGYLLNLHPYLKDVGNVMTGKLFIKDYSKNAWDLNLRSFTLVFEEVM